MDAVGAPPASIRHHYQTCFRFTPYKGQFVPHCRFRMPEVARASYLMFLANLRRGDFVVADMAREFLQMGFTRARRAVRQLQGRPEVRPGRALPGCQEPEAGPARLRLCGGLGRRACRPMVAGCRPLSPALEGRQIALLDRLAAKHRQFP